MQLQYSNSVYKTPPSYNAISKYSAISREKEEDQLRSQALDYLAKNSKKSDTYSTSSTKILEQFEKTPEYNSFATQLKQKKEFEEITKRAKELPRRSSNEITKSEESKVASNFVAIYAKETSMKTLQNRTTSLLPTENSLQEFNKNLTQTNRSKYINMYLENSPQLVNYQVS